MTREKAERIMNELIGNSDSISAMELKHHFGELYTDNLAAKTVLALIKAANITCDDYDINAIYVVATMYYALNNNSREITIQDFIRQIYHKADVSESMKRTIEELLMSKEINGRFVNSLKRVIITSKPIKSFDYVSLLYDLANWNDYDIYKKWANAIIVNVDKESEEL